MSLLLRQIDFDVNQIDVDLLRLRSPADLEAIEGFMEIAGMLGFSRVVVHSPANKTDVTRNMLRKLGKTDGVTVTKRVFKENGASRSSEFAFQGDIIRWEADKAKRETECQYTITMETDADILARCVSCVRLIGAAHALKMSRQHGLRFATYELVTNTLEHGVFSHGSPKACLKVVITESAIHVVYKDNSDPFDVEYERVDDVGVLIEKKTKRGLGLWLIAKITSEFTCERKGQWNVTRLLLTRV